MALIPQTRYCKIFEYINDTLGQKVKTTGKFYTFENLITTVVTVLTKYQMSGLLSPKVFFRRFVLQVNDN